MYDGENKLKLPENTGNGTEARAQSRLTTNLIERKSKKPTTDLLYLKRQLFVLCASRIMVSNVPKRNVDTFEKGEKAPFYCFLLQFQRRFYHVSIQRSPLNTDTFVRTLSSGIQSDVCIKRCFV